MRVRLNSSAIAEIFVQRLCAFKSACPNQDVDHRVLGWTWRGGSKGRAVHGLSGVVPMVYFHFFAAAPSSQLSWLGATLFITGLFVLFRFRPGPHIAHASHHAKA
jgi:hypothetical protein